MISSARRNVIINTIVLGTIIIILKCLKCCHGEGWIDLPSSRILGADKDYLNTVLVYMLKCSLNSKK